MRYYRQNTPSEGEGEELWRSLLLQTNPTMCLLLDAPDDPSLN